MFVLPLFPGLGPVLARFARLAHLDAVANGDIVIAHRLPTALAQSAFGRMAARRAMGDLAERGDARAMLHALAAQGPLGASVAAAVRERDAERAFQLHRAIGEARRVARMRECREIRVWFDRDYVLSR